MISKFLGKSPSYSGESHFSASGGVPHLSVGRVENDLASGFCNESERAGRSQSKDDKDVSRTAPPSKKAKSYVV